MNVIGILAVIFLLSFLTESIVEYVFGQLIEHIPVLKPYAWLIMYVALSVGILGAFVYRFDLLYTLSNYLGAQVPTTPFGIAITGAAIGRGSNYLHDLVSKYFVKPS